MIKRKINFLIIFVLGLLCVIRSVVSIIKDINIDLSKAKYAAGQVTHADTRRIENFTIRRTSYKRVFYFKLNNSDQKFAIHRSGGSYEELSSAIKVRDTIKVYYRPGISEYNTHVFQVEKGNTILVSYKDYNEEISSQTGILLLVGILLTTGSIMWYRQFNILKFMTGLVDGRQNKQQLPI